MSALLAVAAALVVLWLLRDRRTPDQKLRDADRENDREYLEEHLPHLTDDESRVESDVLLAGLDDEADEGRGTGEWDDARFRQRCFEARRRKYWLTR